MPLGLLRRSAWIGVVVLTGGSLAACGATHSSSESSPPSSQATATSRPAQRPARPLGTAVRAALSSLASTPFVFDGTRTDRIGGTASSVTIHGAFDPVTRDGESTEIAGTAAVSADYGASRVVSDRAWALVEGSWYSVPLGRVPVGQILAARDLLAGSHAEGMGQGGARVVAGPRELSRLASRLPASLAPALAGLDHLSIQLTVTSGRPSVLEVHAQGRLAGRTFSDSETLRFVSFGTPVVVHPPASQGVLDIGPPATALPPL